MKCTAPCRRPFVPVSWFLWHPFTTGAKRLLLRDEWFLLEFSEPLQPRDALSQDLWGSLGAPRGASHGSSCPAPLWFPHPIKWVSVPVVNWCLHCPFQKFHPGLPQSLLRSLPELAGGICLKLDLHHFPGLCPGIGTDWLPMLFGELGTRRAPGFSSCCSPATNH